MFDLHKQWQRIYGDKFSIVRGELTLCGARYKLRKPLFKTDVGDKFIYLGSSTMEYRIMVAKDLTPAQERFFEGELLGCLLRDNAAEKLE
jgi:hypothetical protein